MTTTRVPLTLKDTEALMWALGEIMDRPERAPWRQGDPLEALLLAGWPRAAIMAQNEAMFAIAESDWLAEPLSPIQRDILRVCVKNSSWLALYIEHGPQDEVPANRATLRGLAAKLETFGIEVRFIPRE